MGLFGGAEQRKTSVPFIGIVHKRYARSLIGVHERGYSDSLTERVLGAVFEVSNTLGAGFLEKVYQRALRTELRLRGIQAVAEVPFTVTYKGRTVGEYFADLLVEEVLVVSPTNTPLSV